MIKCQKCGKWFESMGFASHRAMHRRDLEKLKSIEFITIKGSVFKITYDGLLLSWVFKDVNTGYCEEISEADAIRHVKSYLKRIKK